MTVYLNTLADAIQDAGYWRWWTAEYPEIFQLEFGSVQLYSPPQQPGQPPSSLIALRFTHPTSVTFLTFPEAYDNFPHDWPNQLQNDSLDPPGISYETFVFNDIQSVRDMSHLAHVIDTKFGVPLESEAFASSPISLAFRAGYAGLIVAAQSLTILNHQGEIRPDQIEEKHNQWWAYWQEYWRLKDTDKAFPTDYACEVTIPVTE